MEPSWAPGETAKRLPSFSNLPAAFRQHAANLSSWFPEVLLTLGAPDLEEQYHLGQLHVADQGTKRVLEVSLRSRGAVLPVCRKQVLGRLDRLADDFESLALQLGGSTASAAPLLSSSRAGQSSLGERLDAATEQMLYLTEMVHAAGIQASQNSVQQAEDAKAPGSEEASLPDPSVVRRLRLQSEPVKCRNPLVIEDQRVDAEAQAEQARQSGTPAGTSQPGKAAAEKNPNSLAIRVHKIQSLPENDPKSPRVVTSGTVWGANKGRGNSKDLTPGKMQLRFEAQLSQMFGKTMPASKSDGQLARIQSLQSHGSISSADSC